VDLVPVVGSGDPITCALVRTRSGAVGTVTRAGATPVTTRVRLKGVHPPRRRRGWTAVVPFLRDTGGTAAGDFRAAVIVRSLVTRGRKRVPVTIQVVADNGLPGLPVHRTLAPGEVLRLEGPSLPTLPPGTERDAIQILISGKGAFRPDLFEVLAYEEVLRGPTEPSTSGTPLPVRWVRPLKRAELAARATAALAAPRLLDDGGAGTLPRETLLVLRDLAPFTGDAPAGTVRVSVRTLAGAEVGSGLVDLPRGAAATVRPLDLLLDPGDLPGGEGQVRVTAADGTPLPRDSVVGLLAAVVREAGTPVASLAFPLLSPEPPGRAARISFPFVHAPDDGSASARLHVLSLAPDARLLGVTVHDLDGNLLHGTDVPIAAGAAVRVDPEAVGADLAAIPAGECQVVVGEGTAGLDASLFVAQAEGREAGTPDTFFPGPAGFESPHAAGDPVRLDLLDARETLGSDPGDRDAWIFVRNGGASDAALSLRAFDGEGLPLVVGASVPLAVAPGESLFVSVEQALSLLGVPVDAGLDYRGCLSLEGTAGGPLSAIAIQLRRSANAVGGHALPVGLR
jgi:hypothetical protein